jgi:translocation and assembly module TamB
MVPTLSGTIGIDRMTVRIAEGLGGGVTTIEVTELNPPPELQERVARQLAERESEDTAAAVALRLDLTVNAPGTVFVVGRGLDARLRGDLRVRGTADDPRIDGRLTLQRGVLEFLGKRLDFRRGEITFTGGGRIDPVLDFEATVPAGDATGIVNVDGRAADPQISLTSQPPLPEDEVLSRILFGKGTGDLSTFEAVQLGQQAAELAGVLPPGSGLVENVRRGLGIDVLNVETGEEGGAELTAGQFVSEGVFVGVEQSLGSNESNVTVEVDITDNIKLEADVGAQGRTGVGIGWEFDY